MISITDKQKKLIEDNHNLIYSFLQKYRLPIGDYYDLAAIGLCKAATSFDEVRSNFSSYAYHCMFNNTFSEKRQNKRAKRIPQELLLYYQAKIGDDHEDNNYLKFMPDKYILDEAITTSIVVKDWFNSFGDREKQIITFSIMGYSWDKIADILSVSKSTIARSLRKARERLHKELVW